MTITVTSNTVSETAPAEQAQTPLAKGEGTSADESAADAKAPDTKAPAKSDTATEEAEESDLDKDESEDEDSDEAEAKESEEAKPRKKSGFQKRIEKLNARATAAQEERDYWKAEALKNAKPAEAAAAQVDQPKNAASDAGKPNPDNFDSYTEYTEALTDWKLDQRDKAREQAAETSRREAEQKTQLNAHSERVKAFAEKQPDFQDVLAEVAELPLSPTVERILLTSEDGPALMYALAKDPAEFERINKLGPLAAARELGRLESKLPQASESTRPEPKKQTKAPAPIVPVGSKGGSVAKSIHEIAATGSQADYERARRKQLEANG